MTEGPGAADAPRTFLEAPSDPQARYPAAQAWMNARLLPLPRSALVQRLLVPFALALGSMAFALALVRAHPAMYWYDPYGRVAFRDHLALGRWLPLLQVVVYAVGKVTHSVAALRIVLAAIGALTVAAAYSFAARIFNRTTGVVFAVLLATNPLFVAISIVPYQEVLFIGLVFAGLSFHDTSDARRFGWLPAAAALNLACLTRYEAWIVVALLCVGAVLRHAAEGQPARGLRTGALLAARYGGLAAIGWLVLAPRELFGRPEPGRDLGALLGAQLEQLRWQLGMRWLLPLSLPGAVLAFARRGRRLAMVGILAFMTAVVLVAAIGGPYSAGNLRQTFIPVIVVLGCAAFALERGVAFVVDRLVRPPHARAVAARLAIVATAAAIIAIGAASEAARFVAQSSDEFDFRAPAAIGAWFRTIPHDARRPIRVVVTSDERIFPCVLAVHADIPLDRVQPAAADIPVGTTHVVEIRPPGRGPSPASAGLLQRLITGAVPADPVRLDVGTIWALH
jgi:hypothetical protein